MPEARYPAKADTHVAGRGRQLTIIGDEGEYVFEQIRSSGTFYESDVLQTLSYLPVHADRAILDVGANIGNHSVFFAEFLDRPVVAVEPQSHNADLLEANLGINNLRERARVVRRPLWNDHERLTLSQRIIGNSGSFTASQDSHGELESITLDELPLSGQRVGLVKIDTEGSEAAILLGGTVILERDHPYVCVEAHDGAAFRQVAEILASLGYEVLDIEGRSNNYLWLHQDSVAEGTPDSLRQLTLIRGTRRLHKQVNSKLDRLNRRLDESDALLESAPDALRNATDGVVEDINRTISPIAGELGGTLREIGDELRLQLTSSFSNVLSDGVADLKITGASAQDEIRELLEKLSSQNLMVASLNHERTQLQDQVNQALDRLRWLEVEKELWRDSYSTIATSRSVRMGAALRRIVGKKRDLLKPEDRSAWIRRRARRQLGKDPAKRSIAFPTRYAPLEQRALVRPPISLSRAGLQELRPAIPPGREIIRAGLASIPERAEGLKHVVGALYDQVDELFVYLNRFDEAPDFLKGDSRIRVFTGDDLGDRGKFRFIDDFEGYFISVDDDIAYPRFYVDHLIDGIERYQRRAAVGWHGSLIKDEFEDYYSNDSRRVFSYRSTRPEDTFVHVLGTGCAAFHTDALSLSFTDFPKPNMADVFFALKGQEQAVPFVVLAHKQGWAKAIELEDARSISTESMADTGHDDFDVRTETNRLVKERMPWRLNKAQATTVREPLSLAVIGRTDHVRWKKGGILKSTNLTADMLRPLGVDVRLFDLDTGDPWNLGGFTPQVVMIYPGDPERPDFRECERVAEHHAGRGSAVLINLSVTVKDSRNEYIVSRMTSWRQKFGERIKMLVFAEQARDLPAFAEFRESIVTVPKTIEVPHPPHATFHDTSGIFLGDIAKLVNADLMTYPAERWIETIRKAVPEAPLYAVKQYRPRNDRDLGVTVLPFMKGDFSAKLSKMRLMINPVRYVTFEMVPVEIAALGVPVIYQKVEQSLSAYLGMSAIEVGSPDDLLDILPPLYRDATLWRAQSRSGQLRSQSLDWRLMATQMYMRLVALAKHSTVGR